MATDKRLSDEELQAEWCRAAAVVGIHGPYSWGAQVETLHNFLRRPHAYLKDYR